MKKKTQFHEIALCLIGSQLNHIAAWLSNSKPQKSRWKCPTRLEIQFPLEKVTHFMLLICNILGVYLLVILKKNRTSLKLLNYCYNDIVKENICDDFLTIDMKILCDFQIVLFYIPVCWYVLFKDKGIRRVSHNFF